MILAKLSRLLQKISSSPNNDSTGFKSFGSGVILEQNIKFQYKDRIEIGNYVYIGEKTILNGRGGVVIGDYSIISSEVIILSSQHNYKDADMLPYNQIENLSLVNIGRCCWIGMRAILLPGVQIGEGCIIGAGSVVTRSFPTGSIIGGNPAAIISYRDMDEYFKLVNGGRYYMVLKQNENLTKIERIIPPKK